MWTTVWLRRGLAIKKAVAAAAAKPAADLGFQRLTPLEHILTCPNMYIGSTTATLKSANTRPAVAKLTATKLEFHAAKQSSAAAELSYIPGLVKIFDEVLVNACDNAIRDAGGTSMISVNFDGKRFVVENDGRGIPVVMHEKESLYIPELVLGHLLTGSNFDKGGKDNAAATTTGGRHGYGAKLANVFSTSFACETVDAGKRFNMSWANNMQDIVTPATVEDAIGAPSHTRITFAPDWARFGLKKMDAGSLSMIQTRVVETAGLLGPKVTVKWNGHVVPRVKNFFDLCRAMLGTTSNPTVVTLADTSTLRVALGLSESGAFEHASYCNNMSTWRGGVHVDSIASQICKYYVQQHQRGNKRAVTEAEVKRHLALFVDLKTNQPEFDSQSKEKLTGLGELDKLVLSEAALRRGLAGLPELTTRIEQALNAKMIKRVNTSIKRLLVPKLEDAIWAGMANKLEECTLILTEGDSAKASAMCGLEVVGRERFGVYPLRGKLLNVRGLPISTVADNVEIKNIMSILGLKIGDKGTSGLRYGRVMFMTDGDHDGSHIKGLLINLFDYYWPELTRRGGAKPFLTQFVTPLLKAIPTGSAAKQENLTTLEFFTSAAFEEWKADAQRTGEFGKYRIKYYKGLGTSSPAEAREYFAALDKHVVDFDFSHPERAEELIDLAFAKARAADRKQWLVDYHEQKPELDVASSSSSVLPVERFVNQELIQYSLHNNERSIPHVLDGLKPSQRKVLFALFLKAANTSGVGEEFKLTRLAGFISEQTAYHHGEVSLYSTMIRMAQDFVGSNNLPLLCAVGQFGSRATGGEDASAARYLSTALSPHARLLFPREDDALLERREDDGVEIEPVYYVPILPLVLVNGSHGVGTGWSSNCPQFHPLDVIRAVREWIAGRTAGSAPERSELEPWYRGFKGTIRKTSTGYSTHGVVSQQSKMMSKPPTSRKLASRKPTSRKLASRKPTSRKLASRKPASRNNSVWVHELPIGMWTDDFKQYLKDRVEDKQIAGFVEQGKHGELEIQIQLNEEGDGGLTLEALQAKLVTNLNMQNLHFHAPGSGGMGGMGVKWFKDVHQVVAEFCEVRLSLYGTRKEKITRALQEELVVLERERNFVERVCGAKDKSALVRVLGQDMAQVQAQLTKLGFSPSETQVLMRKPLRDFTLDRIAQLDASIARKREAVERITQTSAEQIWLEELDKFERAVLVENAGDGRFNR